MSEATTNDLHSQSIESFRERADETFRRLADTARAELLTVDGRPSAVVMSPEAYQALIANGEAHDVLLPPSDLDSEAIRASLLDIKAGRVVPIERSAQESERRLQERLATRPTAAAK